MLRVVYHGGPFDGLEEQLTSLPSTITFDRLASWPGDMMMSSVPADAPPPARYRRAGMILNGRHVYEYEPLEAV